MPTIAIEKSFLKGKTAIPSSKSQTLRAILFAAHANGTSIIQKPLQSPDTEAMIRASRSLGAEIYSFDDGYKIVGNTHFDRLLDPIIDAGNSGIVLRFVGAVSALRKSWTVLTGDHSLKTQRPCIPLLDGIRQLGGIAESCTGSGFAPIIIKGPIKPNSIVIDGQDSQPVSALLIASSLLDGSTEIRVRNPGETPWISVTLDWLLRLGVNVTAHDFSHFQIVGKNSLEPFEYTVPGDLSSLAFPLASALVTESDITIENVDLHDIQGDKVIISILEEMGANFQIDQLNKTIRVKGPQSLKGTKIDINQCIDALPILAVLGTFAEGTTHIYNGQIARKKECDRIKASVESLKKMNANIKETADGLIVSKSDLQASNLLSYNDHRMALASAVAGLFAKGITTLSGTSCIKKTYPTFFSDLQKLGAKVNVLI